MSLHHIVPAVLLFVAAVGWSFTPAPDAFARVRWQTLPGGCVLFGVGALLAGLHGRSEPDLDAADGSCKKEGTGV